MSNDGKLHIPTRKKQPVDGDQIVRISKDAYNAAADVYNESALSMKEIVSMMILFAASRVVYDKEEQN